MEAEAIAAAKSVPRLAEIMDEQTVADVPDAVIANLVGLGFSSEDVATALALHDNNADMAADWLFSQ